MGLRAPYIRSRFTLVKMSFTKLTNFIIMKQNCTYVKDVDIVEVVPELGVDMRNAIDTGIIQDTSATTFHNMMKELGEIGQVVREPFDIIEYDRAYSKFRKYVNDKESKKNKDEDK